MGSQAFAPGIGRPYFHNFAVAVCGQRIAGSDDVFEVSRKRHLPVVGA
jgi:hypothetical protein